MSGHSTWPYNPYKLLWDGLDLLIPPICAGCDMSGARWCKKCQNGLVPIPEPVCDICGTPQKNHGICQACNNLRPPCTSLRSWTVFKGPIRSAIHLLKYRRNLGLGDSLSAPIIPYLKNLSGR